MILSLLLHSFQFRDEQQISNFFSIYGDILESQIIKDSKTGQSKGCAFVKFASMTKAEECIKQITSKPLHLPGVNIHQIIIH